jgi:hypothetical protein
VKLQKRWLSAALSGAVLLASAVVLSSSGVGAVTVVDPAITGDANAANGTIAFFDAAGNQISSGQLSMPFASYAVASSATARVGTPKATLFVATPDHTKANSLTWFNQQLTAASTWPLAGAPAPVTAAEAAGVPAVAVGSNDGDLAGAFAGAVNDATAGYDHIMQIRLEDSGPGKPAGAPFWATDVLIDTTAGTWTQVFPTPPPPKIVTSLSAINASPGSPAPHGSTVTLTSTLSAADSSHPAGSVHLLDGATDLGAASFTVLTGAVSATATPVDGPHSYSFAFTPTDTAAYQGATSATVSYTVNAAVTTTTALNVTPPSPSTVGDPVTLTATISPNTATGTVQFLADGGNLGAPVTVSAGTASTTVTSLTVKGGTGHALTATFLPANSGYVTSTSNSVSYVVNPLPATATTTVLGVSPASPYTFGQAVTLTATVTPPTAAGSVTFLDGSTPIGAPVPVSGGTATKTVTTLAAGAHSLTAQFIPTDSSAFGASTSTPATNVTVNAEPTSTSLGVSPASPVDFGTPVTLTATVTAAGATGTVAFFDGATQLGAPVAVSGGVASTTTSTLTVASHSLTAQFTPTDATKFSPSTSAASTLVVQAAATNTTLGLSPASPVVAGTQVTLTATIDKTAAAGTVQFTENGANLGAPVAVAGGSASTTVTPIVGTYSYTAIFTPTTANYLGSTSTASSLVVNPPPMMTSTTLGVSPTGAVSHGTLLTFTATVVPTSGPAPTDGTVTFKDGATTLGTGNISAGTATFSTAALGGGAHSVTAEYVPADATKFVASTSTAVSVTVNAETTTTALAVTPTGPVTEGDSVTLTATVVPSTAGGTVSFSDGTTVKGSGTVAAGKATLTTTTLPVGDRSLTATFVPTSSAAFSGSTSAAVTVSVKAKPTITGCTVNGVPVASGSTLKPGDTVTISGSGFQPSESVGVVLRSAPITLTSITADATGNVTATVTLPPTLAAGPHSLTLAGSLSSAVFSFNIAAAATSPVPSATPTASGTGTGAGSGGGTALPTTGASLAPGITAAVLFMLLGAASLIFARTYRGRSH